MWQPAGPLPCENARAAALTSADPERVTNL